MPIQVDVADEQSERPVDVEGVRRLAERVVSSQGLRGDAELTVMFVDEAAMAELNERHLGHKGPTDVLSFPIEDEVVGQEADPHGGPPLMIGDVVICPAVAHRQAASHAGTYEDELELLLVHGILHLLGMDHEEDAEAEKMEALERALLGRFGRGSPGGRHGAGGESVAG